MTEENPKKAHKTLDSEKKIPASRFARLARLGSLTTQVTGNALFEGARQLTQGQKPQARDLFLTPNNINKMAQQLAQLRGAAMKVGQLLSMDSGELLPSELSALLDQLRAEAHPMPMNQLTGVLEKNWGSQWQSHFRQFSFQPLAAASIGQVHEAHTRDGRHLAIKIQYPDIAQSIDSDIDNVISLLKITRLLPKGIDLTTLIQDAKEQLHAETDYQQEAGHLKQYQQFLKGSEHFLLPEVQDDLSTRDILSMSYVKGVPIETLTNASQDVRNQVVSLLIRLLFQELFEFRYVQTDPNFANYQYNHSQKKLVLMDFGATRHYSPTLAHHYLQLIQAATQQDRADMFNAAQQIGYFQENVQEEQRDTVLTIFSLACEPLRHEGDYDFGHSPLAQQIREVSLQLSAQQDHWHTPPVDALFLHRKLGGLYLLAKRLQARIDVKTLLKPYLERSNTPLT